MFLNGNGVAKDLKQAFKFFSIATGPTSLPRQQAVLALSCSNRHGLIVYLRFLSYLSFGFRGLARCSYQYCLTF